MARALRIQYPGAFYHVTCRGNARMNIYLASGDREKFLTLLDRSLVTYQVILYSYILMGNHFHLLLQTVRANLAEFMRHLNISYTGWFNFNHDRVGHVLQGRYKAFLVDADNYLLEVSRYVHLNSVRQGRLKKADNEKRWEYAYEYRWSSLPGYIDNRKRQKIILYDTILNMAGGRRAYFDYMMSGLHHDMRNPFEIVKNGLILGDDSFVSRLKDNHLGDGSLREQPSYRGFVSVSVAPEIIIKYIVTTYGIDEGKLKRRRSRGMGDIRGIAAELLYKFSGLTQSEIGKILGGIDYSGVYQIRRRLRDKLLHDEKSMKRFAKVENGLKSYVQSRDLTPEGGVYE